MNKLLPIALGVVVLGAAAYFFWPERSAKKTESWLGYVEGEALYLAAPVSGTLAARTVDRGALVAKGTPLFTLNPVASDAETSRLQAALDQAKAQLENLKSRRQRKPEIAVSQAQQQAARADITRTRKEVERITELVRKGYATRQRLESAQAALQVAEASLAQAQAVEQTGRMTSGRADEVRAAQAAVVAAQSALRGQYQRRSELAPVAPERGVIEQTFYDVGEWVPANAPVLALLPDDKRKIRFFVPETRIATLKPAQQLGITCDGCPSGLHVTVSYISPRAEFTPPVIYSERARAKLVFLVEARLPATARRLPVGLPVDVVPQ